MASSRRIQVKSVIVRSLRGSIDAVETLLHELDTRFGLSTTCIYTHAYTYTSKHTRCVSSVKYNRTGVSESLKIPSGNNFRPRKVRLVSKGSSSKDTVSLSYLADYECQVPINWHRSRGDNRMKILEEEKNTMRKTREMMRENEEQRLTDIIRIRGAF